MMADCFGLELDEVTFQLRAGSVHQGRRSGLVCPAEGVAGQLHQVPGHGRRRAAGRDTPQWQMTPHTEPNWDIKGCYITQIKGDPCVHNKHMIFPKPGVDLSDPDNFASIGMTVTGLPALNSIKGRRRGATGADHQCRPSAARFRRAVQARLTARACAKSRPARRVGGPARTPRARLSGGAQTRLGRIPARNRRGGRRAHRRRGRRADRPDPCGDQHRRRRTPRSA